MTTFKPTALSAGFALALALGLGGCSSEDAEAPTQPTAQDAVGDDTTAPETGDTGTPAAGDAGTQDAGDSANTGDAAEATPDGTTDGTSASTTGDATAQALQAIQTAEEEAGGTAYAIDDQDDDGSWEVDVVVGDRSVEVTVGADGSVVGTEDDDLDDDDRAGVDAATITLSEAIEQAVGEVGGHLDEAELDEDDGSHFWDVSLDGTDRGDDIEVTVSVTGEVLEIEN
ncbi:PepSY domain-containing protein [Ornithinimicrobium sufpigmenti]|uniref:PepSY domain-containing protein n=1 Tax=Ornithinimicrobium sufpigmenti TaxID=2508882 RepID=UPI001036809E|nr:MULTISPECIES: PepSY domain-containing protein [unclassified Ornithinimicrobium]